MENIITYKIFDGNSVFDKQDELKKQLAAKPDLNQGIKAFILTRWWEQVDLETVGLFALFVDERMLAPISVIQKGIETVLDRPVLTHEMSDLDGLRLEYLRKTS